MKYATGYYSSKSTSTQDVHPALLMAHKVDIASIMWREFGISWSDLGEMEPAEIDEILLHLRLRTEIRGPSRNCPLQ